MAEPARRPLAPLVQGRKAAQAPFPLGLLAGAVCTACVTLIAGYPRPGLTNYLFFIFEKLYEELHADWSNSDKFLS